MKYIIYNIPTNRKHLKTTACVKYQPLSEYTPNKYVKTCIYIHVVMVSGTIYISPEAIILKLLPCNIISLDIDNVK